MATDVENILASIDELAKRGAINRNRAFSAWFAINFFDLDEDDALESAAADGGNDQGIDIVFADQGTEEIIILQAHCPENINKVTPKSKWDAVISSLPYIHRADNFKDVGRYDLSEMLIEVKTKYPSYKYAIGLISLGLKSKDIERSIRAHENDERYEDISLFYYAQEDIIYKYKSLIDDELGIPEDELHFSGNHFEDHGDYGRSWVGSVMASELSRLYKSYQDKLFAGNVRLFLGARKGGINEQIIKTAQTAPGNFWALNNGISIVADSAEIVDSKTFDGGSTLRLRRFSIVNGCQTTSSLVKAGASPQAKVLCRVIAAKASIRSDIVRYNNSQNAVKIWTVRAADDIQDQLRKDFQVIGISYAPKQAGSRKKKNQQSIELDKVTQYLASTKQEYLIQAINNKSELFDEPYQKIFKRGIKASVVYLAWLTGRMSEDERQLLANELVDDVNVGLLGVASTYWIVFCTYKIMNKFVDLESPQITLEKVNSKEFNNALKKYVKKAVGMYYDAAVDTYDRDEFWSFKSTSRSPKFLQKLDSKINSRIAKLDKSSLPDLVQTAKSIRS